LQKLTGADKANLREGGIESRESFKEEQIMGK